jgi:hypothetical protein
MFIIVVVLTTISLMIELQRIELAFDKLGMISTMYLFIGVSNLQILFEYLSKRLR